MVQPEYLTRVGGQLAANFVYKWHSSGSGYEVYDLWTGTDWNGTGSNQIKVLTASNTWQDNGSGNPSSVVDDGININCYHSNGYLHTLNTKPTVADWIPVEPATGTEGDDFSAMADISFDTGSYAGSMYYRAVEVAAPIVLYKLAYVSNGAWIGNDANVSYNKATMTWSRFGTLSLWPISLNSINDISTATTTVENPEFLFGFDDGFNPLSFSFENPWYEAPENDPPNTPVFIRGSARRGNLNFW